MRNSTALVSDPDLSAARGSPCRRAAGRSLYARISRSFRRIVRAGVDPAIDIDARGVAELLLELDDELAEKLCQHLAVGRATLERDELGGDPRLELRVAAIHARDEIALHDLDPVLGVEQPPVDIDVDGELGPGHLVLDV